MPTSALRDPGSPVENKTVKIHDPGNESEGLLIARRHRVWSQGSIAGGDGSALPSRRESSESRGSLRLGGASRRSSAGSVRGRRTLSLSGRQDSRGEREDGLTEAEAARIEVLFALYDSDMAGTVDSETLNDMVLVILTVPMSQSEVHNAIAGIMTSMNCADDRCPCDVLLKFMAAVKKEHAKTVWKKLLSNIDMVVDNLGRKPMNPSAQNVPSRMIHEEYLRHTGLMLCDSWARWALDAVIIATTVYYAVMVPLVITGPGALYSYVPALLGLEAAFTALRVVDMAIQLNTVVVDASDCNRVITERAELARRYVVSWGFVADLASTVPLDLAFYTVVPRWAFICLHALRLLRACRLGSTFKSNNLGVLTATHVTVRYNYVPLCRMVINSALFVHVFACAYLLASCEDECRDEPPSPHRYLVAMYWTLYTVSSVGYGDVPITNTGTYLLASVLFVAALIVNGWVIGKISSYIAHLDVEVEHRVMMNRTLQVIKHFNLHKDVTSDILALQEHLYSQKVHLRSFQEVFDGLPGPVQAVLQLYLRVEYLSQVPMFRLFSAEGRIELAQSLMQKVYARGEYIVIQDEAGDAFTVLVHGFAQVIQNGQVIAAAFRGASFGEAALLNDTVHTASVKCVTYSEVLVLERDAFAALVAKFPYVRHHLANQGGTLCSEGASSSGLAASARLSVSVTPTTRATQQLTGAEPGTPIGRSRRRKDDTLRPEDMCAEVYRHLGKKRLEERAHSRQTMRHDSGDMTGAAYRSGAHLAAPAGFGSGVSAYPDEGAASALAMPHSPVTRRSRREERPPPLCAGTLGLEESQRLDPGGAAEFQSPTLDGLATAVVSHHAGTETDMAFTPVESPQAHEAPHQEESWNPVSPPRLPMPVLKTTVAAPEVPHSAAPPAASDAAEDAKDSGVAVAASPPMGPLFLGASLAGAGSSGVLTPGSDDARGRAAHLLPTAELDHDFGASVVSVSGQSPVCEDMLSPPRAAAPDKAQDGAEEGPTAELLRCILHNQRAMYKKVSRIEQQLLEQQQQQQQHPASTPQHKPTRTNSLRFLDAHPSMHHMSKGGLGIFRECQ
eukprot:TRINITY_DN2404_c0_g2_i2.p1 TRINITY_DN2404_c0_g2~~TRINITY_DN2404_c0_g2_i2.p1  ORF type:complete len:1151 (+),score=378.96 TRINITY_DN2404_c0_g2_i2:240-3455(+)